MLNKIFKTKKYCFYSKIDKSREHINCINMTSRLDAARYFAGVKRLDLKQFLMLFSVTK